jgi:hypothetical protein
MIAEVERAPRLNAKQSARQSRCWRGRSPNNVRELSTRREPTVGLHYLRCERERAVSLLRASLDRLDNL